MKTVNSISGGKTSAYIAANYPADYDVFSLVCIDDIHSKPKDKYIIDYVSKKLNKYTQTFGEFIATAEDNATLIAMIDLEQYIGREITWVRGASFDNVIDSQGLLPSWARRYCTTEMKLLPIFQWWFDTIGEKVNMRIGFRFDEFERMERFFNSGNNPCNFTIPTHCSRYGEKRQKHTIFNWRNCKFPLIKEGITNKDIFDFWRKNGHLGGTLFEEQRQIKFPIVSNCVGCFHKKAETLAIMANMHPEKMQWFAAQENKNKGTFLDSKITYQSIIDNSQNYIPEMLREIGSSCDSGGCHD